MEHTLHRDEERIEDGTDADGSQEHGHKILAGRLYGGIKGLKAFAQILQIAIDDHDRVIDNHSQHHNQCRQRHDIQFDTHHIHHRHTHKGAQRDGDGRHDGRTDGEQNHHHQDNDGHRDEQIAQEVAHALCHHLGFISYAGHIHVLGQFVLTEIFQHLIHLLTILHHVITRRHLHRQQHTGVSVLLDTTRHRLIFAYHTGHIANTYHLTRCRVRENNLVGYLLFAVLLCLHMDGYLLVIIADTATHRGDALSLQTRKEHLLTNTIALQTLAVYIKTDLLFLLSEDFHIRYRRDATQAIAQIITVLFQFAVAALVALNGDEQSRGIAKIIVHHDGQHPTGQLRLKAIQPVLNLRPHLVLVVHIIVQFHHHDTHAVLRLRGGLFAIHLTKGKKIAL